MNILPSDNQENQDQSHPVERVPILTVNGHKVVILPPSKHGDDFTLVSLSDPVNTSPIKQYTPDEVTTIINNDRRDREPKTDAIRANLNNPITAMITGTLLAFLGMILFFTFIPKQQPNTTKTICYPNYFLWFPVGETCNTTKEEYR